MGEVAGRGDGAPGIAPAPSEAPGQPATDQALQEAEAALDRLLAEGDGGVRGRGALGAGTAKAGRGHNGLRAARGAGGPERRRGARRRRIWRSNRPGSARHDHRGPGSSASRRLRQLLQKPASPEAPVATAMRADRASGGRDQRGEMQAQPRAATETAALSLPPAPPIATDGDFCIQPAAVRGQADARGAWELFARDLGLALRGVEPIFESADTVNGVFYRGPDRAVRQTGGGGEPVRTAQAA